MHSLPRFLLRLYGPNLSLPMASVVAPPRQLAPTVGPAVALVGVFIRTGNLIASSGERIFSGLVQRFGVLNFVSDNAGYFGTRPLPRGSRFISFGEHQVYVALCVKRAYPERVIVATDPLAVRAAGGRHNAGSAKVMMTAPAPSFAPSCRCSSSSYSRCASR
jgi:hypothetical protein